MRCRQGELAEIVRNDKDKSVLGHFGIVREFIGTAKAGGVLLPDLWHVEYHGHRIAVDGGKLVLPDSWLRPIRYSDGVDETLIYAGKPAQLSR